VLRVHHLFVPDLHSPGRVLHLRADLRQGGGLRPADHERRDQCAAQSILPDDARPDVRDAVHAGDAADVCAARREAHAAGRDGRLGAPLCAVRARGPRFAVLADRPGDSAPRRVLRLLLRHRADLRRQKVHACGPRPGAGVPGVGDVRRRHAHRRLGLRPGLQSIPGRSSGPHPAAMAELLAAPRRVRCDRPGALRRAVPPRRRACARAGGGRLRRSRHGSKTHLQTEIRRRRGRRRRVHHRPPPRPGRWAEAGAIGTVRETRLRTSRPTCPQAIERPLGKYYTPPWIDWDLWLGPAPARPYNPAYAPFKWRGWWDFGTGALGDIACHSMDASFWTLGLGYPTRIEPESTKLFGETAPAVSRITYTFAAKGNRPEVKVVWRDGSLYPPRPKEVADPA